MISAKRQLLASLAILGIIASVFEGKIFFLQLLFSMLVACLVDGLWTRYDTTQWTVPKSAAISGLLVGGILLQGTSSWIVALVATIAVASKHIFRYNGRHIFNPANFGLVVAGFLQMSADAGLLQLDLAQTWWIESAPSGLFALEFLPVPALIVALALVWRMKRWDLFLTYIVANTLFVGISFWMAQGLALSSAFWTAFTFSNLTFAGVMLIEPMTTPWTTRGRMLFGGLVAFFTAILATQPLIPHMTVVALALGNLFVPWIKAREMQWGKSINTSMTPKAA
ncbi:RnfABCDGE type electron transport complex subunit D [Candidatus Woesearchaeota archaeon]|nr:RnfABCDGE type electron transport complex subunit D [Candidatus Woesearchaeota archaeon]